MYKLSEINPTFPVCKSVTRLSDMACIPFDPQNSDYITYLKWIEEGNVPTPADE